MSLRNLPCRPPSIKSELNILAWEIDGQRQVLDKNNVYMLSLWLRLLDWIGSRNEKMENHFVGPSRLSIVLCMDPSDWRVSWLGSRQVVLELC
jgi:hypothetical protein